GKPQSPAMSFEGHTGDVFAVAFAPDGKTLASGSGDGTVKLWEKGQPQSPATSLEGHTGNVFSVAFAPDGKMLASGSQDGAVKLWDADTRQTLATLEERRARCRPSRFRRTARSWPPAVGAAR
ncbi:MAG: WD40 repeat domain-containing protein, partial [Gammaproteobacteria bacterium]